MDRKDKWLAVRTRTDLSKLRKGKRVYLKHGTVLIFMIKLKSSENCLKLEQLFAPTQSLKSH